MNAWKTVKTCWIKNPPSQFLLGAALGNKTSFLFPSKKSFGLDPKNDYVGFFKRQINVNLKREVHSNPLSNFLVSTANISDTNICQWLRSDVTQSKIQTPGLTGPAWTA